jgi:hypothetical protein
MDRRSEMPYRIHPLVGWPLFLVLLVGLAAWLGACGPAAPPAPGLGPTPTVPATPLLSPLAPIDGVSLEYGAGAPPQSFLVVVSGLPDGCTTFGEYTFSRQGDTFQVQVTNRRPADPNLACTMIYGMVTTRIPLEGDIKACQVYTAVVNGREYRVQAIGPTIRCAAPPAAPGTPAPGYSGGVELPLRVGQSQAVSGSGLVITLLAVTEDSRCPRDVLCVWAGQAAVSIGAKLDGADLGAFRVLLSEGGIQPGVPVGAYQVRLVGLSPYPVSTSTIPVDSYLAVLAVSKS